ncbi:Hypothetical predicted protein [Octopus vulgaris]|uniref:Uncharacterized protein n=1 Tax=Octopus vulgaris TaxID=6645 RepID=A0AA36APB8_OCTVU|nr:Hypothetical predicted protein [Octopus vulgaris]
MFYLPVLVLTNVQREKSRKRKEGGENCDRVWKGEKIIKEKRKKKYQKMKLRGTYSYLTESFFMNTSVHKS